MEKLVEVLTHVIEGSVIILDFCWRHLPNMNDEAINRYNSILDLVARLLAFVLVAYSVCTASLHSSYVYESLLEDAYFPASCHHPGYLPHLANIYKTNEDYYGKFWHPDNNAFHWPTKNKRPSLEEYSWKKSDEYIEYLHNQYLQVRLMQVCKILTILVQGNGKEFFTEIKNTEGNDKRALLNLHFVTYYRAEYSTDCKFFKHLSRKGMGSSSLPLKSERTKTGANILTSFRMSSTRHILKFFQETLTLIPSPQTQSSIQSSLCAFEYIHSITICSRIWELIYWVHERKRSWNWLLKFLAIEASRQTISKRHNGSEWLKVFEEADKWKLSGSDAGCSNIY